MADAWPHLTLVLDERARTPREQAIEAAHDEALRLARGGEFDRTHPQRRLAVAMLIKSECAHLGPNGDLLRDASSVESERRLAFWRNVELTRCIFPGYTEMSAPTVKVTGKIVSPDDGASPLDDLPPWDGSGEDILADTEMSSEDISEDTEMDGEWELEAEE